MQLLYEIIQPQKHSVNAFVFICLEFVLLHTISAIHYLDFCGENFYRDCGRIIELNPGWSELLDRYHIRLDSYPKNAQRSIQLSKDPHRKRGCEDEAADLFEKIP